MFYLARTPALLPALYPSYIWRIPTREKIVYLTFDDGPHPVATPFVLSELKKFNGKATFFCIGKNVAKHPELYREIIADGHAIGNHTYHHLNGWRSKTGDYLNDIHAAAGLIPSRLFRPPYGRIRRAQGRQLQSESQYKIIMWDVLSGDFDAGADANKCFRHVVRNAGNGSIIVFHDSEKAFSKLVRLLPNVLEYFNEKGFKLEKIGE